MDSSIWLYAAVGIIAFILFRFAKGFRSPSMLREAAGAVSEGAPIVDVRTREEFAQGHHPGAINIPLQEIGGAKDRLGDPSSPVVVYCRSGSRSGQATRILRSAGFSTIFDLGPQRNTRNLPEVKPASTKGRIPSAKKRRRRR